MTPTVKMVREALEAVYLKAFHREYDEMPGNRPTKYDCQLGDAGHVMNQVADDLEPIVKMLRALEAEDEAEKCPNGCWNGMLATPEGVPNEPCPWPGHKPAADTKGGK